MELWAELRREHFVRGVSIKELARRTGLSRNTIRAALRSSTPPSYRRPRPGSKLDSFKDEIHRLLRQHPDLPGQRARELIAPLGFDVVAVTGGELARLRCVAFATKASGLRVEVAEERAAPCASKAPPGSVAGVPH